MQLGDGDIRSARDALVDAIGAEAAQDAAATVAIFNGLVRVADGTGIQLDEGLFAMSEDLRRTLGLDEFAGAANSAHLGAATPEGTGVSSMFGNTAVSG